jgi:hypothetical protein
VITSVHIDHWCFFFNFAATNLFGAKTSTIWSWCKFYNEQKNHNQFC